ncbi:MAG: sensor histidine kinase [Hominimerdicola sp.]
MIKKLQRKFVLITAVSLFVVELLVVGLINIVNFIQMNNDNDNLLNIIIENNGKFPSMKPKDGEPPEKPKNDPFFNKEADKFPEEKPMQDPGINEETRYQTRYFVVFFNNDDKIVKVDTGNVSAITSADAIAYAQDVLDGDDDGYMGNYKYKISDNDNGKMIVFLDCRNSLSSRKRFLAISAIIAGSGYLIVCILVIVLSKKAIRPIIKSMEKQRQFITDAGHEIKTPLAIISANTEVLELTDGSNEWTKSIKNQITRLNFLIQNLLHLAKMEEENVTMNLCTINISEAVEEAAQPFETLAQTKGKSLFTDIRQKTIIHGDRGAVKQLVSILVENAIKYADDGGEIMVKLCSNSNGKGAELSVFNTCKNPPEGDLSRLFDRFYRADYSRARTHGEQKSGYGIGLSIAYAIMEAHKGKIYCKAENGIIKFTAIFKN